MKILGYIIVVKRSGADGTPYPVTSTKPTCAIGRGIECDIRVQLPVVSQLHFRIEVEPSGKAYLTNISTSTPSRLNDQVLSPGEIIFLSHKDTIYIGDRKLRWEYPEGSVLSHTTRKETLGYKILTPNAKAPVCYKDDISSGQVQAYSIPENGEQNDIDVKRKKVSFGRDLHPEHFDKELPPSTPVSKGEKPDANRLFDIFKSPHSNVSGSTMKRLSPAAVILEENECDTPTKSLLRRRSPTPVKPYLVRSLGLLTTKVTSEQENSITDEKVKGRSPENPVWSSNNETKLSPKSLSPTLFNFECENISSCSDSTEVFPKDQAYNTPKTKYRKSETVCVYPDTPLSKSSNSPNQICLESKPEIAKTPSPKTSMTPSPKVSMKNPCTSRSPRTVNSNKKTPKTPTALASKITRSSIQKSPKVSSPKTPNSPSSKTSKELSPKDSKNGTIKMTCKPSSLEKHEDSISVTVENPEALGPTTPKVLRRMNTPITNNMNTPSHEDSVARSKDSRTPSPKFLRTPSSKITEALTPTTPKTLNKTETSKIAEKPETPKVLALKITRHSIQKSPKTSSPIVEALIRETPVDTSFKTSKILSLSPPGDPSSKTPKNERLEIFVAANSKSKILISSNTPEVVSPKTPEATRPQTPKPLSAKIPVDASPNTTSKVASPKTPRCTRSNTCSDESFRTPESAGSQTPESLSDTTHVDASPKIPGSAKPRTPKALSAKIFKDPSPNTSRSAIPNSFKDKSPKISDAISIDKESESAKPETPRVLRSNTPEQSSPKAPIAAHEPNLPLELSLKSSNHIVSVSSWSEALVMTSPKSLRTPSPKVSKPFSNTTPRTPRSKKPGTTEKSKVTSPQVLASKVTRLSILKTPKASSLNRTLKAARSRSVKGRCSLMPLTRSLKHSPRKMLKPRRSLPALGKINSYETPLSLETLETSEPLSSRKELLDSSKDCTVTSSENTETISQKSLKALTPQICGPKSPLCRSDIVQLLGANRSSPRKLELGKRPSALRLPLSDRKEQGNPKKGHKKVSLSQKRKASMSPEIPVHKKFKIAAKTPLTGSARVSSKNSSNKKIRIESTPKKSWADVLKRGLMAHGIPAAKAKQASIVMNKARLARQNRIPGKEEPVPVFHPIMPKNFDFSKSTGHVNSPAPIFIHKKNSVKTPKLYRKGRKAPMKTAPESIEDIDLEGLAELLNTPKSKEENMVLKTIGWPLRDIVSHFTPLSKAVRVREMLSKNKIASTPGTESDISSVSTLTPVGQRISDSSAYSPTMFSPVTPPNTSLSLDKTSTSACSPSHLDGTSFDFSSVKTPDVTEDNFISPLVTPTPSKTPVQRLLRSSQKSFVASPNISNIDSTTFDFDSAETPNVTQDIFISPMSTRSKPGTPRVESWNSVRVVLNDCRTESPLKLHREAQNSVTECSRPTKITRHSTEGSPRSEKIKGNTTETLRKSAKSVTAAVSEQSSRDSIGKSSPESDYANVLGVAKLLRTPKPSLADTEPDYIDVVGVKRLLRTPKPMVDESGSDVIDITELKKMFKTPKTSPGQQANYSNVEGVKILLKTPQMSPTQGADYADVVGTKKNVTTPKLSVDSPAADYSNVAGVRRLMKTPKESIVDHEPDYSDVAGVKKLLQTPLGLKSSPMADYTNVIGVRNLMRTPKEKVGEREADYAHITGIRKLLRTPKALVESPKGDYSNVAGLKKLLASPRVTHENEADYTNIAGVKKLMKTPIRVEKEREPPCDFTEVEGVKNLLRLPNNEIIADYSNPKGLRKLMATPKQNLNEPLSDYTNVAGIRKLMKTPRAVKSPQVDYTRVEGLRKLMKTPRASLSNSNIDFEGLTELLKSPVLSVNSANVVEQIMDLVSQTSTPSSLRKSKRIKRDQTPVSSSPSENVPPDTELKAVMNLLYQKDSKEINSPRRSKRNEKSTPVLDDTLRKTRSQKASDVGSPLPSKIKHDFESKKNVELGENNSSRSLSDNLPLENVITVVNLIGHGPSQEASGPRRSKRNEQSTPTVDDNPRNTRSRKVVKLESPFSSRQNCPANETESMELDERNLLRNDNVTPKDEPVTAIRLVSHEDLQEVSSPRRSKRNEKSSSKIDDPPRKTRSRKVVDTQSPVSNKRKQNAIVTEVSELNESPRKRTKTNNPDLTGIVIEGKGRHKGKKVKEHVINEDSKSVSNSVEKCSQNTVKSSKETGKTTSEEEILQDEDEYRLVKNQEETSGDSNNCMSDKFKKSVTYADKLEIVVSVEQKNQVEPSSAPVRRRGRRRHPVGEMKDDEALLSKSNTIQDSSKINVETEDLSPDNGRAKCCSVQDTKVESPKKRTQDEINENLSPAVQKGRSRRLKKIGEVNPALPEEKVDEEVEKSLPAVRRGKSRKVDEFLSEAISPPVTKRARSTRGRNSLKKEALEADSKSEKHMEISSGCQEGLPEETEALTCAEDKVQEAPSPKVRRGRRRKNSAAEICDSGAVMNKVTKNEKISSSVLIDNTTAGKAEKKNTKTTRSNKSQKENVNVEPDITCPSENDGEHLPSTEKASSRRTRAAPKAQSLTYEDVERKVSKISGRQTRGKKNSTENSAVTEPEKIEIGPTTRAKRGTRNINNQECVPESPGKVTRKTRSRK